MPGYRDFPLFRSQTHTLMRRVGGSGEFAAAALAGVDGPGRPQRVPSGAIARVTEALEIGSDRTGPGCTRLLWALLPGDAQPAEVFEQGSRELRTGAVWVQVLDAQHQGAPGLLRALGGDPEGARMSKVKQAGGRGGQPPSVWAGAGQSRRRFGGLHPRSIKAATREKVATEWVEREPEM